MPGSPLNYSFSTCINHGHIHNYGYTSHRRAAAQDTEYLGKRATLSIWCLKFLIDDNGQEELRAEQRVINQVRSSTGFIPYILPIIRLSAISSRSEILG